MSNTTLIAVFAHIVFCFTREVTNHYSYSATSASRLVSNAHLLNPNSFRNCMLPSYAVSLLRNRYLSCRRLTYYTALVCVHRALSTCKKPLKRLLWDCSTISHLHIYRKTHVWVETKRKLTFQGS